MLIFLGVPTKVKDVEVDDNMMKNLNVKKNAWKSPSTPKIGDLNLHEFSWESKETPPRNKARKALVRETKGS